MGELEGPGFKCMSPNSRRVSSGRDTEEFEKNFHDGQI